MAAKTNDTVLFHGSSNQPTSENSLNPQTLKMLLVAQSFYPDHYASFMKSLSLENIPLDFTNQRYLDSLTGFAEQFENFLASQKPSERTINEETIESTVPTQLVRNLAREIDDLPTRKAQINRQFAQSLTTQFIASLKKQNVALSGQEERELTSVLSQTVIQELSESTSIEEAQTRLERALTSSFALTRPSSENLNAPTLASQEAVAQSQDQLPIALAPQPPVAEIIEEAVTHETIADRAQYARIRFELALTRPKSTPQSLKIEATKLTLAHEAFNALIERGEDITRPVIATSEEGRGAFQQGRNAAATLLTFIPQATRERVIEAVFAKAWNLATETGVLNQRFGQAVVASPLFQQAIRNGNDIFSRPSGAGVARGLSSLLSDALGSVAMSGPAQEAVAAYLNLAQLKAKFAGLYPQALLGPTPLSGIPLLSRPEAKILQEKYIVGWKQFYTAFVKLSHPASQPYTVSHGGDALGWILHWGTRKGVSAIAKGAARTAAAEGTKKGFGAVIQKVLIKLGLSAAVDAILAFFSFGTATILKWAAQAAVWLSGSILRPIGSFIGNLLTGRWGNLGAVQKALTQYFGVNPDLSAQPKKWHQRLEIILPLLLVASPILLMGFSYLPFNSFSTGEQARTSALVDPHGGTLATLGEPPEECKGEFIPKPASSGVRTTLIGSNTYAFPLAPFDRTYYTCGHHDGERATDIGINGVETGAPGVHLPVVAYTSGVIENISTTAPLGGKYIILHGDDGRFYYYAHNCALYVKSGERVSAGDVLAISDNTGNAVGTPEHLHFAISRYDDFNEGGTVCPAKDFEDKFSLGRCSASEQCPP